MTEYQYQIIRYIHDRITGEFVNVGLIMFEPTSNYLECKVVTKYSRISQFFGEINGGFLLTTLKQFQNQISEISKTMQRSLSDSKDFKDISSVSNFLLPKDDSALSVTDVKYGIDVKVEAAFEDLYYRLVERYSHGNDQEQHTDHYAWQKVYKNHFDKVGVTPKLKKHSVKTKKDTIDFDKAWKNGVWNCYQTLSFDLKQIEGIKNKVYKWSGILQELETSTEPLKIYLLTTRPKVNNEDLMDFIESTFAEHSKNNIEVSVITEDKAENFAIEVKADMQRHNVL